MGFGKLIECIYFQKEVEKMKSFDFAVSPLK
jgi:hypothetical protein